MKKVGWGGESFQTVRPHLKLTDDEIRLLTEGKEFLRWNLKYVSFDLSRLINFLDFLNQLPPQKSQIIAQDLTLRGVVAAHVQVVAPEVISSILVPLSKITQSFNECARKDRLRYLLYNDAERRAVFYGVCRLLDPGLLRSLGHRSFNNAALPDKLYPRVKVAEIFQYYGLFP
jgi:hypothetical protein